MKINFSMAHNPPLGQYVSSLRVTDVPITPTASDLRKIVFSRCLLTLLHCCLLFWLCGSGSCTCIFSTSKLKLKLKLKLEFVFIKPGLRIIELANRGLEVSFWELHNPTFEFSQAS
jgi:hypothetical protein